MDIYKTDFDVAYKHDKSPVTNADRRANEAIEQALSVSGLPLLSEEGKNIPYERRSCWDKFWLVDPLDGTKEFINRNGEFTVNIALIEKGVPDLGVVVAPAKDVAYFGIVGQGAYRLDNAISFFQKTGFWKESETGLQEDDPASFASPATNGRSVKQRPYLGLWKLFLDAANKLPLVSAEPDKYTVVGSRSHGGRELDNYIEALKRKYGQVVFRPAGSSLKICLVAEGSADQYPRLGTTMEWDTAAGHAVARAAGARVYQFDRNKPLCYNKIDLRNPWFKVERRK